MLSATLTNGSVIVLRIEANMKTFGSALAMSLILQNCLMSIHLLTKSRLL